MTGDGRQGRPEGRQAAEGAPLERCLHVGYRGIP
jgi:hypothetical protein